MKKTYRILGMILSFLRLNYFYRIVSKSVVFFEDTQKLKLMHTIDVVSERGWVKERDKHKIETVGMTHKVYVSACV